MTQLVSAVQGDIGDVRELQLSGVDNLAALTSIEARVRKGDTSATLAVIVVDSPTSRVAVNLGGPGGWLQTADVGTWLFEIRATFGATVLTWPTRSPADTIDVRADL